MFAVWQLIDTIIALYMWALIISVVLSWLVQFNVINTSNRFVYTIGDFLYRITEPVLGRIRSVLPAIGGIDLSPMILILALVFLRNLLPDIMGLR
jgi:YggT family protein